ncbi:Histidine kinase [Sphingobium herbicidovorans NBRC 16415]|uniref:histidine kinase n=1 Tax=Sphingobium herbicidovorans (strain ATCC 700291 / DSM 11019 / CCUG 56400 / KCTC 2939 / LMG 18315 / NBRC 16415 / MH) TaxID=1219045 RepID=A0A086PFC3_SPHHM|nr:sensor histidine kinase [Sphingobium herbicidovorans]KFG92091.1 Histidine kinase [Sphingobium herbicidovorans NBRC 16415]
MRSLNSLIHSTGIKMFLILTLALLPLGLIALVASLQAIRTADLEKEALLRVSVTQSARKLTADLASDRMALMLTANALSTGGEGTEMCQRLSTFLKSHDREGGRYYIYDRSGRRLCGASRPEPGGITPAARFDKAPAQLLPGSGYLASRIISGNGQIVALAYYSRAYLEAITSPTTALQNRQLSLQQGDRLLIVSSPMDDPEAHSTSLSARLDPPDILLTMTLRDPPVTLARMLSLFLPLVMWFAAAAIGWFVVNRLLIRPLVVLRRTVAAYHPGEVLEPMRRIRTPAQEIVALGDTFRAISEDVATHEAEMAEGLETQRKLTREVHHRVKNNLQIIASLISLHARAAHEPEAVEAYASIQRRVDALSVVHRNHYAELEEHRGVGVRSLVSELSASLRSTAPAEARRFGIQIDSDNLHISQDVAVPVAFLLTELVELAMLSDPQTGMRISVQLEPGRQDRAILQVSSPALRGSDAIRDRIADRYGRVLTGLSRQLRAPLEHDETAGDYSIAITVVP